MAHREAREEFKMEIVNLIVNVIGFVGLACYIAVLKGQIKSQNKTIENLKLHVEIFQPDKIHEFVKMREITFEDTKNKEIEKIKSEMEKKLEKRTGVVKFVFEEASSLLQIALNLAFYVNHESRKEALERSPNSIWKSNLVRTMETFPYYGDIYRNALLKAFEAQKSLGKHSGQD